MNDINNKNNIFDHILNWRFQTTFHSVVCVLVFRKWDKKMCSVM